MIAMRIIDADRLKDAFNTDLQQSQTIDEHTTFIFENDIDECPTVDAIPVHCKDCKYLGIKDLGTGYCKGKMCGVVRPDSYCSYGERREGKE